MLVDGRSIEAGGQLSADVCVIGAGPVGLTAARELVGAGRRVVVVEAGGPEDEGRGDLLQSTVDVTGLPYFLRSSRRCALGGSAPMWFVPLPAGGRGLRLRELDPVDFAPRPWLGVDGWPIGAADLRDSYRRAREVFDLPLVPDAAWGHWDGSLVSSPLVADDGEIETKAFDFGERDLFLDWIRRTTRLDELVVVHSSPVVELRGDEWPSEVSSAVCEPAPGKQFSVDARQFILAAGAIENARILLSSRSRHPEGIGNANGLVGRHFMEHPVFTAAIVMPQPSSPLADPQVHGIHEHRGRPVQRKYALSPTAAEQADTGNHLFFFQSAAWSPRLLALVEGENLRDRLEGARLLRDTVRHRALAADLPTLAREGIRSLSYPARRASLSARLRTGRRVPPSVGEGPVLTLEVMAEQLPHPSSRVELCRDGSRPERARLDWKVQPDEWRGIDRATRVLARHLETAGQARVLPLVPQDGSPPPRLLKADHHMGTTRMHRDPRHGVVDAECRVHGMANLYLAGSSVFPTGGGVNPMLTILAMAFRLADHLVAQPQTNAGAVTDRVGPSPGRPDSGDRTS